MISADLPLSRPARVEDESTVVALMRDFYAEEHLAFDELLTPRAVHDLLTQPSAGAILLLEHTDSVIGYLVITFGFSLEFHGRYALLDELCLVPAVRGRGWGKHALELAANIARHSGVAALRLEVNHANTRARAAYLNAGFQDNRRDLFTRWVSLGS